MNFSEDRILQEQIRILASRQTQIVQIMSIFPVCYNYNRVPTFQQILDLVNTIEQRGYDPDILYYIFASGKIPDWLDTLIKGLAMNWQPSCRWQCGSEAGKRNTMSNYHNDRFL